jgi:hypothetical protein
MALRFANITADHLPAIRRFNTRMRAGGVDAAYLIEESAPAADPDRTAPVYSDRIVALDPDGEVRGGYIGQWRDYWVDGEIRRLGNYQSPISEGIIDKKYTATGVVITRHALATHPYWHTTGMGGLDRPLPRMLKSLGWQLAPVPFLFRVNRPGAFFREFRYFRSRAAVQAGMYALAYSGAGWLGVRALDVWQALRYPAPKLRLESVDRFDEVADAHWERCKTHFRFAAVRSAAHLNHLYRPGDGRFQRLLFWEGARLAGWAVLLRYTMRDNKYFGNLTTGVLADCLAMPEDLPAVAHAAGHALAGSGVDVSLANATHEGVLEGLRRAGFRSGPTNYGVGLSKPMAALLRPEGGAQPGMLLMRGDGDGLSNF